jgi:hypothetical protein
MAGGQPSGHHGTWPRFPRGQLTPEERQMFLMALVVVGSVCAAFALAVIHADTVSARLWALWGVLQPQRLRGRGWGWPLVPLGVAFAMLDSNHPWPS